MKSVRFYPVMLIRMSISFFTDKHILFEFDNTKVVSRLIEGEYFRISHMLSVDYQIKMKINKREFLDSLDRATLLIKDSDRSLSDSALMTELSVSRSVLSSVL